MEPCAVVELTAFGNTARSPSKLSGLWSNVRGTGFTQFGSFAEMAAASAIQDGSNRTTIIHGHSVLLHIKWNFKKDFELTSAQIKENLKILQILLNTGYIQYIYNKIFHYNRVYNMSAMINVKRMLD